MPIDPSIPLMARAPQINTPFENLDQVLAVRQREQAVESGRRTLEDDARARADQEAIRSILAESQGDWRVALPKLRQVAPDMAMKIEGELAKQRKAHTEAMSAELKLEGELTDRWLSRLRALPPGDDGTYQMFRRGAMAEVPDLGALLPESYDPERLTAIQTFGESAKDALARQDAGLQRILKGEWRTGAGTVLSTASDAEEWAEMLAGFRALGMPESQIGLFGAFSPENVQRAAALAMTPAERGTAAARAVDDERQHAQFEEVQRHNRVTEATAARTAARLASGSGEPLVAVVGPDGQPVLLPRSQAAGRRPASERSNLGARGVTSGDANRIAEMETSLDDVQVLRREIGATGTASAVEAAVPNWITDLTGWGADAKARQAVIDRVKQVIGKALEGGVLRKEDEYKYTKILPTIGDTATVAKSKLDGLESALRKRRTRLVENLEDAGYDISRFREREAPVNPFRKR